jgi:chromosome segregation ATPase
MLESIMLIALGFLIATLFSLIAIQLVWRRAVKVTTRDLSDNLDLDDLKSQAERAAALDMTLQEKRSEIIELSDKNAQLEETLANTRQKIDTLSQDIVDAQARHAEARAEAETHLHNLTLLHARVDELEAAAHSDMEKRNHAEAQLKSLGEKALQLVTDMNAVAADLGGTVPEPHAASTKPDGAISLTPFPADEPEEQASDNQKSADLPELATIKASLSDLDEAEFSSDQDEEKPADAAPRTGESYLAERIRALKEGVSASA